MYKNKKTYIYKLSKKYLKLKLFDKHNWWIITDIYVSIINKEIKIEVMKQEDYDNLYKIKQ